jgi:RimJ/RimL family protein N-acetyltransferase
MLLRLATMTDFNFIKSALLALDIPYINPLHAINDIRKQRMYILEENGKIIAQCSLVPEEKYNYIAIKRLVVYPSANRHRGIGQIFLDHFISLGLPALGCTPWSDNAPMLHLLIKNGFKWQYTFLDKYEFFLLTSPSSLF